MPAQRSAIIKAAFDASAELALSNPLYARQVDVIFRHLLKTDTFPRDISLQPRAYFDRTVTAIIKAKSVAVVAGLAEIQYALRNSTLQIQINYVDGQTIQPDEILLQIEGKASKILSYERTILNILQRLSGIATLTHHFATFAHNTSARIAATRKTLWGWLDKKAVAIGGGLTHRLGLFDAAMLKENHLTILNQSGPKALLNALQAIARRNPRFIEVEVTNSGEFWQVIDFFLQLQTTVPCVIMFDHFSSEEIATLINALQQQSLYDKVLLEASGNISEATIRAYATCGVDIISIGALTHSARSADFSLLIKTD